MGLLALLRFVSVYVLARVTPCGLACAGGLRPPSLLLARAEKMRLLAAPTALWLLQSLLLPEASAAEAAVISGLAARRAEWKQCVSFSPHEDTVCPPVSLSLLNPQLLDPAKEGTFAKVMYS